MIEFLVDPAPDSLPESIRKLRNASASFCQNWLTSATVEALKTSTEAFALLDHIQNQLLRHRDDLKAKRGWVGSAFKQALETPVGISIAPLSAPDLAAFLNLPLGICSLPPTATPQPLLLVESLNRLKHRASINVNFTVQSPQNHVLYVHARAGMGQPDSLSQFDVRQFCDLCSIAEQAI